MPRKMKPWHISGSQKKQIEAWYKRTVDEHRSESFRTTFEATFEQEFQSVFRKIENAKDSDEVVSIARKYTASLESLYYNPPANFEATDSRDFETMKSEIIKEMNDNKEDFSDYDDSLFAQPSDDAGVMSLLGCTERCHWCSALCWGQRGHEAHQDETKKHHSSHQPRGLALSGYKGTDHLVSKPCHAVKDDDPVWFGEYHALESGILWKEAKEKHFNNWIFDTHYNSKFDELMRWFFYELHESIAENSQSMKPATQEDMEQYNCVNLSYEDIITRIEQKIN